MATLALDLYRLDIPFRVAFKHGSAERDRTQAVWVEARIGARCGVGEGCPREYVTHEDLDSAAGFFARYRHELCEALSGLEAMTGWMRAHERTIDANPAAWCAIELAVLDAWAQRDAVPVEALLALPPVTGSFRYTAVIGDADPAVFRGLAQRYARLGFRDFKLKLSADAQRDRDKLAALAALGLEGVRIRCDANNLWHDAERAADHLASLGHPFLGIEEPLRAHHLDAMRRLSQRTGLPIILDESLLRARQIDALAQDPQRWIANIRVSKMGGVLRSLELVRRCREAGIPIIVGAQVGETSVLTRAALPVVRAAGDALIAQEGAFGTLLLERDVCDPPLMFGDGGILDAGAHGLATRPGWGLALSGAREHLEVLPGR